LLSAPEDWESWSQRWLTRLDQDKATPDERSARMLQTNPAIIPRNHLVERAIRQMEAGDSSLFMTLWSSSRIRSPRIGTTHPILAPIENEKVQRTFCGT